MNPLYWLLQYFIKPTMEPKPFNVALCIGHSRFIGQKRDGGAVSAGNVQEWDYNHELAEILQEKLGALGIKSFIVDHYQGTGYTDAMKWLASHLDAEHATHAVELHFNAATGTARGHEFLYWHSSTTGQKMAIAVNEVFNEWFPDLPNRGPKSLDQSDRGAEFVKRTRCPAIISEPFFGDNPKDWALASEGEGQYQIAGAIALGIKRAIDP